MHTGGQKTLQLDTSGDGPACQNTVFQSPKDTRNGSDQIPSCQAPASTSRRRHVFSARRLAHQSLSSTLVFRCGLQLLSGLTWTALLPLSLLMLFSHYSCIDDLICINSIWFAQQQQKSKRRLVAQRLEKHQGRTKQTSRRQHQAKARVQTGSKKTSTEHSTSSRNERNRNNCWTRKLAWRVRGANTTRKQVAGTTTSNTTHKCLQDKVDKDCATYHGDKRDPPLRGETTNADHNATAK